MDDLLLWDGCSTEVQKRLDDLREGFAEWGLRVNIDKSSPYNLPKHKGPNELVIDGISFTAKPSIQVMGTEFKVGASTQGTHANYLG